MVAHGGADHADVTIDGRFGEQTVAHVEAFQRFFDLEPDGWVGRKTWPVFDLLAGQT